jgi:hypothetical protein
MVDKKIEIDIKSVKVFLEFWEKFHSIYSNMISRATLSKEDEDRFLESRDTVKNKYDEMKNAMEPKYMPHGRLTDPVCDILGLESVHFISEKRLKKLNDDWNDSYVFLNNILERLKNNRRRLEQFNPVGVFLKRVLERK